MFRTSAENAFLVHGGINARLRNRSVEIELVYVVETEQPVQMGVRIPTGGPVDRPVDTPWRRLLKDRCTPI